MNNTSFGGAFPAGAPAFWAKAKDDNDNPTSNVSARRARLLGIMVSSRFWILFFRSVGDAGSLSINHGTQQGPRR
jgi:hypothetical protein